MLLILRNPQIQKSAQSVLADLGRGSKVTPRGRPHRALPSDVRGLLTCFFVMKSRFEERRGFIQRDREGLII